MEKPMFRNLTQVYALLVCFVMVIIMLISLAFTVDATVAIQFPEKKISQSLKNFESDKTYRLYLETRARNYPEDQKQFENLSGEELTARRIYEKESLLEGKKHDAQSQLLTSIQWLVLSTLFFAAHWLLYRRASR